MAVRRFLSRNAYIARMQNVGPPVRRIASFPTADVRSGSYSYPVRSVCKATLVGRTGGGSSFLCSKHVQTMSSTPCLRPFAVGLIA